MVVFEQKWLNSIKSGCIRVKVVVIAKVVILGQKYFYSGKMVVLGQSGCI